MKAKKNSTYSFHFTTSSLFIFLVIVFGCILSWQNYNKTSEIVIASGDQVFDQISTEITLEIGTLRKSVKQIVSFIAHTPIGQWHTTQIS
jgi:predicted negative regulator of RcsB-dependent stress response